MPRTPAPIARTTYGVADGHPGFQAIRIAVHLDAHADRLELEALLDHALSRAPIPTRCPTRCR